ncbi:MMPL family transporter [Panacagrimonas sp.]|uniref:MMPL family transporter n=1 Tax=Panacagrimonas sp. TaxID=2480088 RepID=UPI003B520D57
MAALVLLYALRVAPQLQIETDLFALLPAQEVEPVIAAAQQQQAAALSGRLLFLLGTADAGQARVIATQFAGKLRASRLFASVALEAEVAATDSSLYREHRHGLLAESQRLALREGQHAQVLARALRDVHGPGLLPRALPVAQDPFNFLGTFIAQQAAGFGDLRPEQGLLMLHKNGLHHVLITAQTAQEAFSVEVQDRIVPAIRAAEAQARDAGAQVLSSGVVLHAAAATRQARSEIGRVGSLSIIGVALMILVTFRSLRPLVLGALVLGCGALAALSLCQLLFGKVTLIALVFGSALIGVAVDYSIHFLADQFRSPADWTPWRALRHVGPGIAMGMGCAVLGYLSLGLTPLPGLRQMAVFSATGLMVACGCVLCWYPLLAARSGPGQPLPLRWALALDGAVARIGGPRAKIAAAGVAVIALLGLARVEFADDVQLLSKSAPSLLADDLRVRELLGTVPDSQFFVVHGATPDAVLRTEEQLREALDAEVRDGAIDGYRALSLALPSQQRQQDNRALLAAQVYREGGIAPQLMNGLGFPPELVTRRLDEFSIATPPLLAAAWLASAASLPWRDLWLGSLDQGYGSIVSLNGIKDVSVLRELAVAIPGVQFVDRVATVSALLERYRKFALLLLAAAYVLIGVAMALRYGARNAARLMAAPLCAALLTIALLGGLGGVLNLFHVLGLFVVLGLGVDYAVFLREGLASRATTVLAISLSTLGAMLSYGLLSFSATPFIRAIGLTLLIGVGLTWLLALLLQRPATIPQEHS